MKMLGNVAIKSLLGLGLSLTVSMLYAQSNGPIDPITPPPGAPTPAPVPEVPAPSFDAIKDILSNNCTGCHNTAFAYADVVLETEADVLARLENVLFQVETGAMPFFQPEWKDSDEGKLFLSYLKGQLPPPAPTPVP